MIINDNMDIAIQRHNRIMSLHTVTPAEADALFDGDVKFANACGYEIVDPEKKAKKITKDQKLGKGVMSAEEMEIIDIMSTWKDIEVTKPYILARNIAELLSRSLEEPFLYSWITQQPGFSSKCSCIRRIMTLWPGKYNYLINGYYTGNSVILLHNGCFFINSITNPDVIPKNFRIYIQKLRKNYIADIEHAKETIAMPSATHGLDKYYFVPYLEAGIIRLHIPTLRDYDVITSITLKKFIGTLLGL